MYYTYIYARQLIQRAQQSIQRMQIQEQVSKKVWEMKAADVLTCVQLIFSIFFLKNFGIF